MSVETDVVFAEISNEITFEEAGEAVAKAFADKVRLFFAKAKATSIHNADLMEAIEGGSDFRIAFRKPGETEWTRLRMDAQETLRELAAKEVMNRQEVLMDKLSRLLGVDALQVKV